MSQPDPLYDFYRAQLAYLAGTGLWPESPDTPQCGYYRLPTKDKQTRERAWIPFQILNDAAKGAPPVLVGVKNDGSNEKRDYVTDPGELRELFGVCLRNAVPEDIYADVLNGASWPEHVPAYLPNSFFLEPDEAMFDQERAMEEDFLRWIEERGELLAQAEIDRAADFQTRVNQLIKEAEASKKAEKEPHQEALKAIEDRYARVVDACKALKTTIQKYLTPALVRQKEAAERAQAELAEKGVNVKVSRPRAGVIGSASLRTYTSIKVLDVGVLFDHYATDSRFRGDKGVADVLGRLALADLKAGKPVAGAALETTTKAA